MAVIGNQNPTLTDLAKMVDDQGRLLTIVEMLNQNNPMLMDMGWTECNDGTNHKTSIRTGLPTSIWRKLYQGIPTSKAKRAQVQEATGMLAARSEVDVDLAALSNDVAGFRLQEATAFTESMNQTMQTQLLYGSKTLNPDRWDGLAERYGKIVDGGEIAKSNIIDAGGTGSDNTSVWLICWGPNTVSGLYPRGMPAGLQHKDLGEGDAFDENNDRYRALMDEWKWHCGLTVRDWRYVVRICNIDMSQLESGTGAADLVKLMTKATHRIPNLSMGRPVFYCSRSVHEALDLQVQDKATNTITTGNDVFGNPATTMRGIPIRTVDAILHTEARVV